MSLQLKWLTSEYLEKILRDFFNDEGLKIKEFSISPGSKTGDGYLSQIFRVKADTSKKKISIITKVLLKNLTTELLENTLRVYDTEKIILQTLLPKMLTKLSARNRFYPELYHADDMKRTFFIEDLCENGYQLCEHDSLGLDLRHSLLVMEVLAKLHSTSYLVFKENPDVVKNLENSFYSEKNRDFVDKMVTINSRRGLMEVLNEWDLPNEYKTKLKNSENWTTKAIDLWQLNPDSMNVLLHNDCWINNLMFKYNKTCVEDVKLIDFQIGTYNCFAFDLLGFIFSSTATDVRLNCTDELIDCYYSKFTEITGEIPNFTKNKLRKEFNDRLFLGFLAMIAFTPWVMAPPKKMAVDIDALINNEELSENIEMFKNPKYLDCVEKLLPYFIQHNVI